jgi:dihydroflavonol-4-reductase
VEELVSSNVEVIAVGMPSAAELPKEHVQVAHCRFSDTETLSSILRGCDVIFPAGGYYPVFSVDRTRQIRRALSELRSTLDALRQSGATRFIFTSSPLALVDNPKAFRRSTYHALIHTLHEEVFRWIDRGLPCITIIPGACFGPGDWKPTTGRAVVEIANRRMRFVLDGIMNAVDVRDVARGQVQAMKFGSVGSLYQMGNWNGTCADFSTMIAEVAHIPPPTIRVPYEVLKTVSIAAEWLQYLFHAELPLIPQVGFDMAGLVPSSTPRLQSKIWVSARGRSETHSGIRSRISFRGV